MTVREIMLLNPVVVVAVLATASLLLAVDLKSLPSFLWVDDTLRKLCQRPSRWCAAPLSRTQKRQYSQSQLGERRPKKMSINWVFRRIRIPADQINYGIYGIVESKERLFTTTLGRNSVVVRSRY